MIFKIFVTIGRAITRITIFPPNNTLSPKLELPVSEHILAVNSIKYPTPIIFKSKVYKLELRPVKLIMLFIDPKMSVK